MFLVEFAGHALGGSMAYNEEQQQHGGWRIGLGLYRDEPLLVRVVPNWQSEFFSVGVLVVISIWLRQQGSAQSKPVAA